MVSCWRRALLHEVNMNAKCGTMLRFLVPLGFLSIQIVRGDTPSSVKLGSFLPMNGDGGGETGRQFHRENNQKVLKRPRGRKERSW
jgi:hypothetical protein